MILRWIVALIALPCTVLIAIPMLLSWLALDSGIASHWPDPGSWQFWVALILAVPGAMLALWSGSLFFRFGEGTAAPWDPPQKLVVRGPYRHVRNPMLTGVILLLFAEAFFFRSWLLAEWAAIFSIGNAIYFPFSEEPGLRKRFGREYEDYCQHVPRWIPRLRGWHLSTARDSTRDH